MKSALTSIKVRVKSPKSSPSQPTQVRSDAPAADSREEEKGQQQQPQLAREPAW